MTGVVSAADVSVAVSGVVPAVSAVVGAVVASVLGAPLSTVAACVVVTAAVVGGADVSADLFRSLPHAPATSASVAMAAMARVLMYACS